MRTETPFSFFKERLAYLNTTSNYLVIEISWHYDYDSLMERFVKWIGENEYRTEQVGKIEVNELRDGIQAFESKIPELVANAVLFGDDSDDPENIDLSNKLSVDESIILEGYFTSELLAYKTVLKKFAGIQFNRVISPLHLHSPKSFNCSKRFDEAKINELYFFLIGPSELELFDTDKENVENFTKLLKAPDVAKYHQKFKFQLRAETKVLAFIFLWLEKNKLITPERDTLFASECFFDRKGNLIKKSVFEKEQSVLRKFVNTNASADINHDTIAGKLNKNFLSLNSQLQKYFGIS